MPVRLDVQYQLATAPNGKAVDVHRPVTDAAVSPVALLWHGVSPDDRAMLRPLARAVAALGVLVLVPDWRSDASDGGREHLLASLEYARAHAPALGGDTDRFVLAGWSAGAPAALGIALHPELTGGWRPSAVVGVASRYDLPARTTGTAPLDDLAAAAPGTPVPVPVDLVHGTEDTLMDIGHSRRLLEALTAQRWPARLEAVRADHAGAAMTEYDPVLDRCRPSEKEEVRAAGELTALVIARAAGIPGA
ncbi:alpha/beta hydrolase [Streptomyces cinnamoneus]|uniref:Alpha/beta hydrolase n=1 Tax=Streptomyces cinnamoneus TaxID=53446 RepID=A0A2G1XMF4_STRCJ|nr:alpha/beta hydrolase [Streptomyces cinnamoneus]PHQ52454.1 alpha/beta hydrolase [Streptomyces cinnamoneus]PPT15986.1 alpha/beta hydrolase [Streptomyces cinnamoneus]